MICIYTRKSCWWNAHRHSNKTDKFKSGGRSKYAAKSRNGNESRAQRCSKGHSKWIQVVEGGKCNNKWYGTKESNCTARARRRVSSYLSTTRRPYLCSSSCTSCTKSIVAIDRPRSTRFARFALCPLKNPEFQQSRLHLVSFPSWSNIRRFESVLLNFIWIMIYFYSSWFWIHIIDHILSLSIKNLNMHIN